MNRIIDAVKSTVPDELWPEILRKLDGEAESPADQDDLLETDDADYDPAEFAEDDDDDDLLRLIGNLFGLFWPHVLENPTPRRRCAPNSSPT